jgi:SAM-dependent methyltransferase
MPTAPWYVDAFTEAYLDVYANRDAVSAEREARGTLNLMRYHGAQGRLLDLASGAGRHARAFRLLRCPITCLDLSAQLVQRSAGIGLPTVRGDMRLLPFADQAFAAVACLFSSFGYFDTDEEHLRVLAEVERVLRPGAAALFDLMDPQTVRYTLRMQDVEQAAGRIVEVERALIEGGRRVEKQIRVYRDGAPTQSWHESVRLFTLDEFEALATRARLRLEGAWGDYDGRPHLPGETRQLVVLRKPVRA